MDTQTAITQQNNWYIHNLDPVAFQLWGEAVPWYWLNYLFGFFWCWYWLNQLSRKGYGSTSHQDIAVYVTWGWLGMLLGSRVGYILFYNLSWYKSHPDQILAIWNGGMSFHGGLIGLALACWLVSNLRRTSLLSFTDHLALLIPWPLATGRACNFINGELPGRPTDVSWAVQFPAPWNDFPRHPSQLYEALTEGVLLGLIMLWGWYRLRHAPKPGLITALFLASYGALRFFTEFTREPDPQLGYVLGGLSMGQILCLVMVAGAALLVKHSQRTP